MAATAVDEQIAADQIIKSLRVQLGLQDLAERLHISARTLARWESGAVECPAIAIPALLQLQQDLNLGPQNFQSIDLKSADFTFIDLFAGIGGIRSAFETIGGQCVFTSEWNKYSQQTYAANFKHPISSFLDELTELKDGHLFAGDITQIEAKSIPDHDVLLAGFPCQPFSIAGVSKKNSLGRDHGFADATQGTLFFDVARIIEEKQPKAFLLENVKNLLSHDKGRTFEVIRRTLVEELGYAISYKVINGADYVPQGRQRIIIVGFKDHSALGGNEGFDFENLTSQVDANGQSLIVTPTMSQILHPEDGSESVEPPYTLGNNAAVNPKYILTPNLWNYLKNYAAKHRAAGNGFGYGLVGPESVARTLSARYYKDGSEILVSRGADNRPRRLTPRECARLMGFDDSFIIPVSDTQAYRQFGNSVVVPAIRAVANEMRRFLV